MALGLVDKQSTRRLVQLGSQKHALALARGQARGRVWKERLKRPELAELGDVHPCRLSYQVQVLAHGEVGEKNRLGYRNHSTRLLLRADGTAVALH